MNFLVVDPDDNYHVCYVDADLGTALGHATGGLVVFAPLLPQIKAASNPPKGETGFWTEDVTGFTNRDKTYRIAYYHGNDGGCWQRPPSMSPGEEVVWWCK
jgi:hypothetical protein